MSETLTIKDTINRTGYTNIDGVRVAQYTCVIQADNPSQMTVSSVKLKKDLYKANRDTCRRDLAEFEDACYDLQDKYLTGQSTEESKE